MTDRELLDQIWLKLLDMETRMLVIEKQTACKHEFVQVSWGPLNEPPIYRCRRCGARPK